MPVLKTPQPDLTTQQGKAAQTFHIWIPQASTQNQVNSPCLTMILYKQGHQANRMLPPKQQITLDPTAECEETFPN